MRINKITLLLTMAMLALPAFARDFEYTFEGKTLTYTVIDEESKTCRTKEGSQVDYSPGNNISGDLTIPATVSDGTSKYTVTEIGDYSFVSLPITSVILPNSLTNIGKRAFYNSGLTSVTIPANVTSIGIDAFCGCNKMNEIFYNAENCQICGNGDTLLGHFPMYVKKIIIGENVKKIPDYTFDSCRSIQSISIPSSVVEIGKNAFYGCYSLKYAEFASIAHLNNISFGNEYSNPLCYANNLHISGEEVTTLEIPANVTKIGDYTFINCENISTVRIPNSVIEIGEWAFFGCKTLTSVEIPNSVIEIGECAFHGCETLNSMEIPNSVTKIGRGAFAYCSNLTSVVIPNSITEIESESFSNCYSLTTVIISDSITKIGTNAFDRCRALTSVTLPNTVTEIGKEAFIYSGLSSIVIPNSVTEIGESAFYGCSGLTSLGLPNSLTKIGSGAFRGCSALTSIEIPNSVTEIGEGAFTTLSEAYFNAENCNSCGSSKNPVFSSRLKNLIIGENVKTIPSYAFYGCSGLTEITIPVSITEIGWDAFAECKNMTEVFFNAENCKIDYIDYDDFRGGCFSKNYLKKVVFGESVKSVPNRGFEDCKGLTEVHFSNSITKIGYSAFSGCSGLTEITIPNSVIGIGSYAFDNCTGLTEITIPNSVTEIGHNAFNNCTGLTEITIPNSVTEIGRGAFAGCKNMTEVFFNAEDCYRLESVFPSTIRKVTFGDGVKRIPEHAFSEYSNLAEVIIPNSVTEIGSSAFYFCSGLTEITIPNSVTKIGMGAFAGCENMTEVFFNAENCLSCGNYYQSPFPSSITKLTIGESVKNLPEAAFYSCSGLEEVYMNAKNCQSCGTSEYPAFPKTLKKIIIGNNVERIPDYMCYNFDNLTEISIPESVKAIGNYAFRYCTGLTNVPLTDKISTIGKYAYSYCSGLTEVTIPASVSSIGEGAFDGCNHLEVVNTPSLEDWLKINFESNSSNPTLYARKLLVDGATIRKLVIPEGVERINSYAFVCCEPLVTVNLPESLKYAGSGPFSGCSGLQRLIFPSLISYLSMQYDSYSSHLNYDNDGEIYIKDEKYDEKNVNWPEEYTHIPDYAFYDTKLEHINIPPTVVSIGRSAFEDCKYLNEISIPASVRNIGQEAFYNCRSLKNVDIESLESWISIPFADEYANPIKYSRVFTLEGQPVETLYIDCNNYSLGQYAFFNARNIVNLRIRCNEIGEEAFAGCSGIKNLCLDVNSVGDCAFENCKGIETIFSTTVTPPVSPDNAFSNYSGVNLFVPYGSVSSYENARNCWWRFLDVYESDFNNLDDLFGNDIISGISDIYSDSETDTSYSDGEYELYDLNGLKISGSREALSPGLYIVRRGGRVEKILVR